MTVWNPNAPRSLGLEWRPRREVRFPIDTLTEEMLAPLPSSVAETISHVYFGLASPFDLDAKWIAEVFATGAETPVNKTCILIEPNSVSDNFGSTRTQAGLSGSANYAAALDDLAGQPCTNPALNLADYVTNTVNVSGAFFINITTWFNVPALVGKRILSVKVRIFYSCTDFSTLWTVEYDDSAGNMVWKMFAPQVSDGHAVIHEYVADFNAFHIFGPSSGLVDEFDRATLLPWTVAGVNNFKNLGGADRQIRVATNGGGTGTARLYAVGLEVEYCDENRLGTGVLTNPTDGWNLVALAANWAKANATNYRIGLRRGHKTAGSVSWLGLDDGEVVGPPGGAYVAEVAEDGTVSSVDPTPLTPGLAVALRRSDATTSVDGQTYASIDDTEVYSGHSVEQEFRGADGSTYRYVDVQVRDGATPTAPLLVEIVRRSDGVVMFDAVISTADYEAVEPNRGWRRIGVADAAGSVLAAATQYARRLTSTAPAGSGWTVGLLVTGDGVASYGTTADIATVGGVDMVALDLPGVVATVPAGPASITVDVATMALPGVQATKGGKLQIDGVEYAAVSWPASGLAALFERYEVERDDGAGYGLVATIDDEAIVVVDDHEALFVPSVCYRVRAIRDDGVPSDWTAPDCVALVAPGCAYVFTTNQAPELACAYVDTYERGPTGPVRDYELPDADDVVLRKMHGRDGYVAFVPTERLGEAFSRRLNVQSVIPWTGSEVEKFAAPRAISLAPVPYVCVRTGDGDRWYANVQVRRPRVQRTTRFVTVDVAVAVVAFEPFPMSFTA